MERVLSSLNYFYKLDILFSNFYRSYPTTHQPSPVSIDGIEPFIVVSVTFNSLFMIFYWQHYLLIFLLALKIGLLIFFTVLIILHSEWLHCWFLSYLQIHILPKIIDEGHERDFGIYLPRTKQQLNKIKRKNMQLQLRILRFYMEIDQNYLQSKVIMLSLSFFFPFYIRLISVYFWKLSQNKISCIIQGKKQVNKYKKVLSLILIIFPDFICLFYIIMMEKRNRRELRHNATCTPLQNIFKNEDYITKSGCQFLPEDIFNKVSRFSTVTCDQINSLTFVRSEPHDHILHRMNEAFKTQSRMINSSAPFKLQRDEREQFQQFRIIRSQQPVNSQQEILNLPCFKTDLQKLFHP